MVGAYTPSIHATKPATADVVLTGEAVRTPARASEVSLRPSLLVTQGEGHVTVERTTARVAKDGDGSETQTVSEPTSEAGKTLGVEPQPDSVVPTDGTGSGVVVNTPRIPASVYSEAISDT